MKITELNTRFGAILSDVNLQSITSTEAIEIRNAIRYYKVVSIPSQSLDISSFQNFTEQLGTLVAHSLVKHSDPNYPFADIVYRNANDKGILFGESWHSDASFEKSPPDFTCLYGDIIPPVRNVTKFADSVNAYERLTDEIKKKIHLLEAIHTPNKLSNTSFQNIERSDHYSSNMNIQNSHPIVKIHPHTLETYLNVNYLYTTNILNYNEEQSNELLIDLFNEQIDKIYEAEWSDKMVLIWDNRLVVHKAHKCPGHERKIIRYLVRDDKL
jgi:taurine dioxygenase